MDVLSEGTVLGYSDIVGVKECEDRHMKQALATLTVEERSCLLLWVDEKFTFEEIAEIVEVEEGEVQELLQHAMRKLRLEYLQLKEQEEESLQTERERNALERERDLSKEQMQIARFLVEGGYYPPYLVGPPGKSSVLNWAYLLQLVRGVSHVKQSVTVSFFAEERNRVREDERCEVEKPCHGNDMSERGLMRLHLVFASEDQQESEDFERYLTPLRWYGKISSISRYGLASGRAWNSDFLTQIERADIVLLFLSEHFEQTSTVFVSHMMEALKKIKEREMWLVPVMLRWSDWSKNPLKQAVENIEEHVQFLPINRKPLTTWKHPEEAFVTVIRDFHMLLDRIMRRRTSEIEALPIPTELRIASYIQRTFWRKRQERYCRSVLLCLNECHTSTTFSQSQGRRTQGEQQEKQMRESIWRSIYETLAPSVRGLVYSSSIPSWHGQENEIADDIVQETLSRVVGCLVVQRKGDSSDESMIGWLSMSIADELLREQRLLEKRITHLNTLEEQKEEVDGSEEVREMFEWIIQEICQLPSNQQRALLVDLANQIGMDEAPVAFLEALQEKGIHLSDYQQPLIFSLNERRRTNELASYAYKNLSERVVCKIQSLHNKRGDVQKKNEICMLKRENDRRIVGFPPSKNSYEKLDGQYFI